MNDNYDIQSSFERIEDILITSMIISLTNHLTEEELSDLDYAQWQALQVTALYEFRKQNEKLFTREFDKINKRVEETLINTYNQSSTKTEQEFLKYYSGKKKTLSEAEQLAKTYIHKSKLDALIDDSITNLKKAEHSILRVADDVYRKVIFDSQVYFATAGTLPQAIDMATRDFLSQGIHSIQYSDGRMVNIASYSEMALRTASTRATLQGEAYKRDEWGNPLVLIVSRSSACPRCINHLGKVYFDDVWGTIAPDENNTYPLLSDAIASGLYHPNCKDSHTTYFEGITKIPIITEEVREEAVRRYELQQVQRYNERQIRKYKRLELGSITEENKKHYGELKRTWQGRNREFIEANNDILRRDYRREKIYDK